MGARAWREADHPRHPRGTQRGGRFRDQSSWASLAGSQVARLIVPYDQDVLYNQTDQEREADRREYGLNLGQRVAPRGHAGTVVRLHHERGQVVVQVRNDNGVIGDFVATDPADPQTWRPNRVGLVEGLMGRPPSWVSQAQQRAWSESNLFKILNPQRMESQETGLHIIRHEGRTFYQERGPSDWATEPSGPNPFTNDEQGREELRRRILSKEPVVISDLAGGGTASTNRWQFRDGWSIVRKQFGQFYEDDDGWEGVHEEYDDEQILQAQNEFKASRVAQAIGAPAMTVIPDPEGHPATVYYGYIEGDPYPDSQEVRVATATDEAVLIGVLDLLIVNEDRPNTGANWIVDPDGKPVAIDHGEAQFEFMDYREDKGEPLIVGGPFARHLARPDRTIMRDGKFAMIPGDWIDNPLTQRDIKTLHDRVQALWAETVLSDGQMLYMHKVLDKLGEHATGTRDLVR